MDGRCRGSGSGSEERPWTPFTAYSAAPESPFRALAHYHSHWPVRTGRGSVLVDCLINSDFHPHLGALAAGGTLPVTLSTELRAVSKFRRRNRSGTWSADGTAVRGPRPSRDPPYNLIDKQAPD